MSAAVHVLPSSVAAPKQARSERTLYRLLDAAEVLIAEHGLVGLSIPEIARRAGSSVGGFYARFRDKNELLRALEERFFHEVSARLEALADERRWADADVGEIVAAAVHELVSVTEQRRELIRAFVFRATQDRAILDHAVDFRRRAAERMGAVLLAKAPRVMHPEPALALDLAVQAAFALMQNHVMLDGTRAAGRMLTLGEVEREIERLVLAYVGLGTPASTARPTQVAPTQVAAAMAAAAAGTTATAAAPPRAAASATHRRKPAAP
jgi:AcrR family transcriptional regulator